MSAWLTSGGNGGGNGNGGNDATCANTGVCASALSPQEPGSRVVPLGQFAATRVSMDRALSLAAPTGSWGRSGATGAAATAGHLPPDTVAITVAAGSVAGGGVPQAGIEDAAGPYSGAAGLYPEVVSANAVEAAGVADGGVDVTFCPHLLPQHEAEAPVLRTPDVGAAAEGVGACVDMGAAAEGVGTCVAQ